MTSKTAHCLAILLTGVVAIACRPPAGATRPVAKLASHSLRYITAGPMEGAGATVLAGSDAPVLVLLHGLASKPSDWLPVARRIGAGGPLLFVLPEGPRPTAPPEGRLGGRAWWKRDRIRRADPAHPDSPIDLGGSTPPGMVAARERVVAFLDELEAKDGIDARRVILGGFSQGAVLALDVVLHDRRPFRGLALLSGTLVNERECFARLSSRRRLPVFLAHSPEDTVLPFDLAVRLRGALERQGWPVTWRSFEGGHAIPAVVVEALGAFARATMPLTGRRRSREVHPGPKE